MAIHLIVDGYNLIRHSAVLHPIDRLDLEAGRQALLDLLAAYKRFKSHRITVVFDGMDAPDFYQHRDSVKGIRVLFSRSGQSADTLIIQMIRREGQRALIVSSDREIQHAAEAHGAAAIDSDAFARKLMMIEEMPDGAAPDDDTGWVPTTRKKGPRRRLSKKQRKVRHKIDKL